MKKFLSVFFVLVLSFCTVHFAQAANLVPCGDSVVDGNGVSTIPNPCGFDDVILLFNIVIDFVTTVILLPIIAVLSVWIGFTYLTAGSAAGKAKAKASFKALAFGILAILGAWVLVKAIMIGLGFSPGDLWLSV